MFKKIVFVVVLVTIFLSGIFFMFAQENRTRPNPDRRRYDHEFDRLSQEERRRLHARGSGEVDYSARRANRRIKDDNGPGSVKYKRRNRRRPSSSDYTPRRRRYSSRSTMRRQAREYLRRNNPEMSERELDELIENMLDQLIRQLEARIAQRTRLRLKRQLASFLSRLIKKYKVDPGTAQEMTRERARRELERIKRNGDTNVDNRSGRGRGSSRGEDFRRRPRTRNIPSGDGRGYRRRSRPRTGTPRSSDARKRRYVRVRNRRKAAARRRAARRRAARRRAVARRRNRRRSYRRTSRKPVYVLKRFVIGNDKNGLIVKTTSPKLVTVTVHTNSKSGNYCYAVFRAISLDGKRKYKIHVTRKFLMLDYRTQYQFYWGGYMHGSKKSIPDGRYRIHAVVAVHNARGRVVARPSRYWGGRTKKMSVRTRNKKKRVARR